MPLAGNRSVTAQEELAPAYEDPLVSYQASEYANAGEPWPTFAGYLKTGPIIPLSDSFFAEGARVGFGFSGGFRERLLPELGPYFFDLGGSFMSAAGRDSSRLVSGTIANTGGGNATRLPAFQNITLQGLRRVSLNTAVGAYYHAMHDQRNDFLFSLRCGGRLGHVNGRFERVPTPELVAQQTSRGAGNFILLPEYGQTDTFLGIFGGIESVFHWQEFFGGDLSLLVDAEIGSDWIELEDLIDDSLPTASIMFGLTVRR
jgi:hypothetical protein